MQDKENSKKYLNRLKALDTCIKQKQEELVQLRSLAQSVTIDVKAETVQTNPNYDRLSETVVKIVCLEDEVCTEIEGFAQKKHKIINEIQSLDDDTYISILFKKYVEYKTLEQIAFEINYSYDHTKHLHSFALKSFQNHKYVSN